MEPFESGLESGLSLFDQHVTGEALGGLGLAMLFNLQLIASKHYSAVAANLEIDERHPPVAYQGNVYYNYQVYCDLACKV